jgi:hypothetical protein
VNWTGARRTGKGCITCWQPRRVICRSACLPSAPPRLPTRRKTRIHFSCVAKHRRTPCNEFLPATPTRTLQPEKLIQRRLALNPLSQRSVLTHCCRRRAASAALRPSFAVCNRREVSIVTTIVTFLVVVGQRSKTSAPSGWATPHDCRRRTVTAVCFRRQVSHLFTSSRTFSDFRGYRASRAGLNYRSHVRSHRPVSSSLDSVRKSSPGSRSRQTLGPGSRDLRPVPRCLSLPFRSADLGVVLLLPENPVW